MANNNGSILNSFNSKLIQDTRSNNDKCTDSQCFNSASNNANILSNKSDGEPGASRSDSNQNINQNNQCNNNIGCENNGINTSEIITRKIME